MGLSLATTTRAGKKPEMLSPPQLFPSTFSSSILLLSVGNFDYSGNRAERQDGIALDLQSEDRTPIHSS